MKGKFEDLMRILSDEGKDKEESEESQVNLKGQSYYKKEKCGKI